MDIPMVGWDTWTWSSIRWAVDLLIVQASPVERFNIYVNWISKPKQNTWIKEEPRTLSSGVINDKNQSIMGDELRTKDNDKHFALPIPLLRIESVSTTNRCQLIPCQRGSCCLQPPVNQGTTVSPTSKRLWDYIRRSASKPEMGGGLWVTIFWGYQRGTFVAKSVVGD